MFCSYALFQGPKGHRAIQPSHPSAKLKRAKCRTWALGNQLPSPPSFRPLLGCLLPSSSLLCSRPSQMQTTVSPSACVHIVHGELAFIDIDPQNNCAWGVGLTLSNFPHNGVDYTGELLIPISVLDCAVLMLGQAPQFRISRRIRAMISLSLPGTVQFSPWYLNSV